MIGHALGVMVAFATTQTLPLEHVDAFTTGLAHPTRIALADDVVLIADPVRNEIVRFDATGTYLGAWSEPAGPVGIAAFNDGRLLVARRDDARVAVYDTGFVFQHFLEPGIATLIKPTDLAHDPVSDRIYIADSGADRIYGFDNTESLTLMLGVRGSRSSEFMYPGAIAVDPINERLIVADQDNVRVQVFTTSGIFLRSFGYRNKYTPDGTTEGWMPRTTGLAVDSTGNILVIDALMGTLRLFNPNGAEVAKLLEFGTAVGNLRTPCGVAVDSTDRIIVANTGASRVDIFNPPGLTSRNLTGVRERGTNDCVYNRLAKAPHLLSFGLDLVLTVPGWDPPHMLDDVDCARCHGIAQTPGGHVGLKEGQANLCFSCHNGGGHALATPIPPTANVGMSHAWGVPAVNAAHGPVGPDPDGPMALYLDNGDMKCATCHEQHNNDAGTPFLRGSADALCKECHADYTNHTPHGTWQPTCTECHTAHDPFHRNLSLIAATVLNRTLSVDMPVVFLAETGANSFDDGDPTEADGICQVCHTQTTYHLYNNLGTPHFDGQKCTTCHPHDAGFLPAGGSCTGCHSGPQGPRRAIVGEFPVGDAHAHYGAELDDAACVVCHSVATHMNGYVELIDADDGSLYSFQRPADLTSDPDLSDFCASCHDEDGATRLANPADPFGAGNTPPDVASRFRGSLRWNEWYIDGCFANEGTLRAVNSHHDISSADQDWSGAKIECLNCHGAHNASATQPLGDPFNPTSPWTGDGNGFCLSCHAGGMGPLDPALPTGVMTPLLDAQAILQIGSYEIPDACTTGACSSLRGIDSCDYGDAMWYVDFTWTNSAHGPGSKRGWANYSGAPDATLDCLVCHDPHGSYTDVNTTGNPYLIRDVVDGTPFVDDGVRPGGQWTGPPWNTHGVSREVVIHVDTTSVDWGGPEGLCSVCHADWLGAYDWHSYCNGCQVCHAHGMLWGEHDWGENGNDVPCPSSLRAIEMLSAESELPPHLRAARPDHERPTTSAETHLNK